MKRFYLFILSRCDREIRIFATCSSQFAKAGSAAALLQQEKSNSADVLRGRVNITEFI
jgi:hypothetical protein